MCVCDSSQMQRRGSPSKSRFFEPSSPSFYKNFTRFTLLLAGRPSFCPTLAFLLFRVIFRLPAGWQCPFCVPNFIPNLFLRFLGSRNHPVGFLIFKFYLSRSALVPILSLLAMSDDCAVYFPLIRGSDDIPFK